MGGNPQGHEQLVKDSWIKHMIHSQKNSIITHMLRVQDSWYLHIYTFTLSQMQVNIRYMEQFGIFSDCPPPNKHLETSPTNSFHGSPPKWLHEGGLHPWSLTVRPWKMVIGRWSYLGPLSLFIGKLALKLQGKKCLQRIGDRNSSSRLLEVP